jgi:hypothetical protein
MACPSWYVHFMASLGRMAAVSDAHMIEYGALSVALKVGVKP